MSEVWEFKNGVMRIVEMENLGGRRPQQLLVYLQTEELITSHQMLEDRLRDEGWVHYPEMSLELIRYHSPEQALLCDCEQTLLYSIRAPNLGMTSNSWTIILHTFKTRYCVFFNNLALSSLTASNSYLGS
ncbi:hypothetical protein ZIOFF_031529 [Zingiber officinale]|uniref:Uncharacterized protein n=1 Tax=Zingiber officinale TaxID=94328 RepID=A0A8J5LAV5_ZINOF|nr:hypothetical protein ZIOFF_031529 [Zingiber officinale]